jgi:SAM-dependent methyltransferase
MTPTEPVVASQAVRGPSCPTCRGSSKPVSGEFEGYIEGYRLSILECRDCTLRFSSRFDTPHDLYENIYAHTALLPGYDRYAGYTSAVTKHDRPLDLLASSELPYWLVRDQVRNRLREGAVVVDLGCGEGYLTYALRREGINCIGVDVSTTAVQRARRRFRHEDWFLTVDELAERSIQHVDLVIAVELIEHVPQPVRLVDDAVAMLNEAGTVLMTTPNRDASPPDSVWDTDLPPVHLTWFGTTAMSALAAQAGCEVSFPSVPDSVVGRFRVDQLRQGIWPPLLTASGQPSTAVVRARSIPWRARRRIARSLASASELLDRSPYRDIPGARQTDCAPATLGACFTARSRRLVGGTRR